MFLLYLLTRSTDVAAAGPVVILFGVPILSVGAVALAYHVSTVWLRREALGPRRRQRAVGAAVLLLANFPAAALCAHYGTRELSRYRIDVTNVSGATVDSFVITVDAVPHELGPIPPGKTVRASFFPQQDGNMTYAVRVGGTAAAGELIGYVTHGPLGGDWSFDVGPGGTVTPKL
ncbi:MAG TPA: hypothetical protein VF796_24310 [Humisphaera sp.]